MSEYRKVAVARYGRFKFLKCFRLLAAKKHLLTYNPNLKVQRFSALKVVFFGLWKAVSISSCTFLNVFYVEDY